MTVRRFLGPAVVLIVIIGAVAAYAVIHGPTTPKHVHPGPKTSPPGATTPTKSTPSSRTGVGSGSYAALVLRERPIAFWRLDDASGGTARDSTGRYPGTYVGGPSGGQSLSGSLGTGTNFDGVDDHVTANSLTQVTSWPGYAMEVWVRLSQETNEEHIVAFNTAKGGNGPAILHDQPTRKFKFRDCEGHKCAQVLSKTAPNLGALYHVVVSVDPNGQGSFYVNGLLQGTFVTTHLPPSNGLFTIGGEYDTGPTAESFFAGEIGDVAVYAHPLDSATIREHYEAGR
jgi:Concanavalin A-like lectin/glucanases superfamily